MEHGRGPSACARVSLSPATQVVLDGREVLALTSPDGRAAHAIRSDGYPLVRLPSPDELTALQPA